MNEKAAKGKVWLIAEGKKGIRKVKLLKLILLHLSTFKYIEVISKCFKASLSSTNIQSINICFIRRSFSQEAPCRFFFSKLLPTNGNSRSLANLSINEEWLRIERDDYLFSVAHTFFFEESIAPIKWSALRFFFQVLEITDIENLFLWFPNFIREVVTSQPIA